jgi:spore maturation protein SpmA
MYFNVSYVTKLSNIKKIYSSSTMRLFVSTITATVVTLASSTVSAFVVAVSRPSSSSPLSPTIITTSSSTTSSSSQLKMSQEVQQPDVSSYMSGARPVSYHAKSKSSVI